jgi:hypothetical protein
MSTELEQARDFLRRRQASLAVQRRVSLAGLEFYEEQVKAGLSWVWDAQERAGLSWEQRGFRISKDQREAALVSFPPHEGETAEDWERRAYGTYLHHLNQIGLAERSWRWVQRDV